MEELKLLKKLVSIPSDKNTNRIISFISKRVKKDSKQVLILKSSIGNDILLAGINCELKNIKPIVLCGHIDTVSPSQQNPYKSKTVDNKVYGLGIADMKAFTSVVLENIKEIAQLNTPVVFVLTTDEETSFSCIEKVVSAFNELNISPKFTIVGEPTNCEIKTSSNGSFEFTLEIIGKACHLSCSKEGINSIILASKIISFLETEQKNYKGLTLNPTIIEGGEAINTVPQKTNLKFTIRTNNFNDCKNFLDSMQLKIEELRKEFKEANFNLKTDYNILPLQDKNEQIIKDISKKFDLKIGKFEGACEAGYLQQLSNNTTIVFGVGDLSVTHQEAEHILIDDYTYYKSLLIDVLKYIER